MLLLAFPELKVSSAAVRDRLAAAGADEAVFATWEVIVAESIEPGGEADDF